MSSYLARVYPSGNVIVSKEISCYLPRQLSSEVFNMSTSSNQRWESQIKEKNRSLRKVTLDSCFRIKNSEDFQAYFHCMITLNPALSVESDTADRLIASLDPLKSFTTAASAASQDEEGLHIIWAALHALTEVICHFFLLGAELA